MRSSMRRTRVPERGVSHTSLAEIATAAGVTRRDLLALRQQVRRFDALFERVFAPLEENVSWHCSEVAPEQQSSIRSNTYGPWRSISSAVSSAIRATSG